MQQAILKMVEGSVVKVPPQGGRKHPHQENIEIDTSGILFIAGGSFEGVDKIIKERQKEERMRKNGDKARLGFGSVVESKKEDEKKKFNDLICDTQAEDMRKFGMLPEFVGRFPIIAPLKELTEDQMVQILTEPKNALVKQYRALLLKDGVDLTVQKDALREIAKEALAQKTGARGLRSIMEEILIEHMFDIPDNPNIKRMVITKSCLTKRQAPLFEYHNEEICVNQ